MGMRVKLARTASELDALVRLRHDRLVEARGRPAHPDRTLVDARDALPTTRNFVAVVDGDVRGGVRVLPGTSGPCGPLLTGVLRPDSRPACCDRLCAQADDPVLITGLLRMAVHWASLAGHSHLCGTVQPELVALAEPVGFVSLAPEGPMVLDLTAPGASVADFLRRQDVGLWADSLERAFFAPGDRIVEKGEVGDEAYLVVDGVAEVARRPDDTGPTAVFRPGDMFGELALLTRRPRASTIVAAAPTDLMVLRREQFRHQVASDPDLALQLMESIGNRFHDVLVGRVTNR